MRHPRREDARAPAGTSACAIGCLILVQLLAVTPRVTAQEPTLQLADSAAHRALPAGTLSGSVLDASTNAPLAGSTVLLSVLENDAPLGSDRIAADSVGLRRVVTSPDGAYRFDELPAGRYRLRVQRMGYRPATLMVTLPGESGSRVSVGLAMSPVRLEAIAVRGEPEIAFVVASSGAPSASDTAPRVRAVRARQRRYASTDVREITDADVFESVTLGETDLFRALQRLPSITAPSFESAQLWTRGSSWDRTRIYFDGAPLFAPFHESGTLTGLGNDLIGAAVLFPGTHPIEIAEGGPGVLDLRSRTAVPDGRLHGLAELTSTAGRLALSHGADDGMGGWSLAARHETTDLVHLVEHRRGAITADTREYFDDVAGRWDRELGATSRIRLSGIFSRDANWNRPVGASPFSSGASSNAALSASLSTAFRSILLEQRLTLSSHGYARHTETPELPWHLDTLSWSIRQASVSGIVSSSESRLPDGWSAGYDLTLRAARGSGSTTELDSGRVVTRPIDGQATLPTIGLWGERTWSPSPRLTSQVGLRVDGGAPLSNAGAVRLMPQAQLRFAASSRTAYSISVGRGYQYSQSAPATRRFSSESGPWYLASRTTPALRSDVLTIGAERWLAKAVLLSVNAYTRRTSGILMRDPTPIEVPHAADGDAPFNARLYDQPWPDGTERSLGIEVSARRLAGRFTGSLGYSLSRSRLTVDGVTHPSDQDRPWTIDASLLFRATRRLQLGAAYSRVARLPSTSSRRYIRSDLLGRDIEEIQFGEPNGFRGRPIDVLDIQADWTMSIWKLRGSAFMLIPRLNSLWRRRRFENGFVTLDQLPSCAPRSPGERCYRFEFSPDAELSDTEAHFGIRIAF